jgi:hypothetical protein
MVFLSIKVFWDVMLCFWLCGFHLTTLEYDGSVIVENIKNHSPNIAPHPRRYESTYRYFFFRQL